MSTLNLPKFSFAKFTLELLKVEIHKTASIDRFHKTDGEFIFQKLCS
ncbi:hypothetical protein LEP1GSC173_4032 [Leptospira interrogans str. HAI1594]|nr:hypothetical protein LIH_01190 [Leptospira interrogans serovar Hardjo-prajitno]EKP74064.1 hypothetical protein LEP1GSC173_4032 [Leptospira interrogans str. HAI1594]